MEVTERSLEFLVEIGFQAVEFSHGSHWSPDECETVRAMTDRIGILPWSLHAWAGGDVTTEEGARQTTDGLTVAVRNALILGAARVIHHPWGKGLEDDVAGPGLYQEASLLLEIWQPGMRFAFENVYTVASMEYATALADTLTPEKAGVCVDTGHAALGDLGPGQAIRMAGPRLITTHLQDNMGAHDDHLPPCEGAIDWDDVLSALKEVDYQGCLLLELTDQPNDPARRPVIQQELRRAQATAAALAEKLAILSPAGRDPFPPCRSCRE